MIEHPIWKLVELILIPVVGYLLLRTIEFSISIAEIFIILVGKNGKNGYGSRIDRLERRVDRLMGMDDVE